MRVRLTWLLATILILAPAAATQVLEVPLTLEKRPDQGRVFFPLGITRLPGLLEAPEGEWKFPPLNSEVPIYSLANLGDGQILFILDRKETKSPFYDRLYADTNGNRDLTDDPVLDVTATRRSIPGTEKGMSAYSQFRIDDAVIQVGGKPSPYHFKVNAYYSNVRRKRSGPGKPLEVTVLKRTPAEAAAAVNLNLFTNAAYRGAFSLGDKTYHVILSDNNADGRFGRRMQLHGSRKLGARNDLLYLSTTNRFTYQDGMEIGDLLCLGGRVFGVEFHPSEGKLALTPKTENLVRVPLPMEVERLHFVSEDEATVIMAFRAGKAIALPAGRYRLHSYQVNRKDDGGNVWELKAAAEENSPVFSVGGGETPALAFGEPYVPTAKVLSLPGKGASLQLQVLGAGGEVLKHLRCLSANKSSLVRSARKKTLPLEPTYKVLAGNGEVAAQGTFKYG